MGATPLHEAGRRDDWERAQGLLAAQPGLTIRDTMFAETPLDWANRMQRAELIDHFERHKVDQATHP